MSRPRPIDVPGLRDTVVSLWRGPQGRTYAQYEASRSAAMTALPTNEGLIISSEVEVLARAELYWVSEEMGALLQRAAPHMPSTILMPDDVPDEFGFVVFEDPIKGTDAENPNNDNLEFSALVWACVTVEDVRALSVGFYQNAAKLNQLIAARGNDPDVYVNRDRLPADQTGLFYLGSSTWPFVTATEDMSMYVAADEQTKLSMIEDRRLIQTLFLLMEQKATDVTEQVPTRQMRRQAERKGRPVPTVRVVNLASQLRQAPSGTPEATPGHRQVNWTHRWAVGPFWRNQWYPSEQRHRPVFILPFVKGPADKPFVDKQTVRTIR